MWVGGQAVAAKAGKDAADGQKELSALVNGRDQEELALGEAGNVLSDAKDNLSKADTGLSYARQEADRKRVEEHSRRQEVEAAEQKTREFRNSIKNLADNVEAAYSNWSSSQDYANMLWWIYDRDCRSKLEQGILETVCEQRNAFCEIIRVMHAAAMKLGAAITGTSSSASVAFNPPRYLKIPEVKGPPLAETSAAKKAWRDYDAQREQFEAKRRDGFYDNEKNIAEGRLAEARRKARQAEGAHKSAEASQSSARKDFEGARKRYSDKQADLKKAETTAREKQLEERNKAEKTQGVGRRVARRVVRGGAGRPRAATQRQKKQGPPRDLLKSAWLLVDSTINRLLELPV